VDENKLEELRISATETRLFLEKQLYDLGKIPYSLQPDLFTGDVELVSKHKLSSKTLLKIFDRRKLKSPFLTDGGVMSTGKETLAYLKGDDFVDLLIKFRIVDKLLNGFINKLPQYIDDDLRVRAGWNNTGTATGRLSSSKPNLQQLPKVNPDLPFDFKSVFVAPKGKKLVSIDYSGQELRILAIVSREETLLQAFRDKKDPHLMTANGVFGLNIPKEALKTTHKDYKMYKKKYEHERHIGKNGYNFPIVYGTTAYGISKNIGISEKEADRGIESFFSLYPGVRKAIRRCSEFLKSNWHVRAITGRRRRLNPDIKKSYRQAFNFLIQSVAADMLRCACNKLRLLFLGHPEWEAKIIMLIHDEAVIEMKEEYVDTALPKLREAAETAMNLPLEMEVEIGVGDSYSQAK